MNIEQLLAAVRGVKQAGRNGDPGATASELGEMLGISKDVALKQIRAAVKAGVVKAGMGYRHSIVGRLVQVPVYMEVPNGAATTATEEARDGRGGGGAGDQPGAGPAA